MEKELRDEPALAPPNTGNGNGTDYMTQAEVDAAMAGLPANDRRGPFYPFTFRNFRLFFYGQTISVAGTWMQTVAQQWLVWKLTGSAAWLGIVSGASAIPYVLFATWGGQVADRYPRRDTLVWTQTAAMILAFVLAFLTYGWWIPVQPWHVALLAGLSGIVNAFNMPTQQAFITDMVDDRKALGSAIALNSFRFNMARILGPIFAGVVLVKWGAATCFLINGLSFIAVIISLLMMRLPPFVPHAQQISMWGGFGYIWRNRSVFRTVALIGAASLFAWSVSTLYPVFATLFHRGARGYSNILSVNGVGAATGGLTLAILGERLSRRKAIYGGAFLYGSMLLMLSFAPTYAWVLFSLACSGFAMISLGISCNTKVQEEVPDALRGRVMAVYSLVFSGLMPVGGLEIGFLAEHLKAVTAVQINASVFLFLTTTLLVWSLIDARAFERAAEQYDPTG
ncbi:MAG TPA: MFS transporter [Chthonomonadaceae bacterium]|nr:MFS transporter [Chthonomonadaceae bacterium]